MRNWQKIFLLFLVTLNVSVMLNAQNGFTIHLGPSVPMSDFGSSDARDFDSHGTGVGFSIGCQYVYPLSESGLGLFGGLDFSYNGISKKYKEEVWNYMEELGVDPEDEWGYSKYYNYLNMPISAGISFAANSEGKIEWFSNIGLTANFLKTTEAAGEFYGYEFSTDFKLAYSIGFRFGCGVLINDRISIALKYLGLGEHNLKATSIYTDLPDEPPVENETEIDVDILTFTLGFTF